MHLAFLSPEYPHDKTNHSAGLGSSIKNMATAMNAKGIKITLFIYGQDKNEQFEEDGIIFHLIQQRKYPILGWYRYRKYLQNYLNKFIVSERIDALEAPDWTGITAFMKLKCPLTIRMNGSDTYFCHLENRPQKKKNFWFEKIALTNADHLISVSAFTGNKTKILFKLKKEVHVIPNAVDVQKFIPVHENQKADTILYYGSIIRKKGVLDLAEIFNHVNHKSPKAKLILAGRDVIDIRENESTLNLMQKRLSKSATQMVEWKGILPYQEISALIASARVVVLPSYAEALPMTWIEAMAMEKALVTSDIGWAKEVMIDSKTGFTVAPSNHTAYAERIIELLENKELAKEMGRAARERVITHFSTEVVTQKNIDFYKGIIG